MITTLSSALRTVVGPSVANHLWQSTVVLVVAGLLTLALRKNQARTRYWLWLTASMKFLVPFSLLMGLGSHMATAHSTPGGQTELYMAMDRVGQPFSQPVLTAPVVVRPSPLHDALPLILTAVWLCGSIAIASGWIVRWRRVTKMMRDATPLGAGREFGALRGVEAAANLRAPLPLLRTRARMEPGIFGIFRPVLLWPEGISEHLEDTHIHAIMAHELRHVRRRDNLSAVLHMTVEAIFWFHPLVWMVGARLLEERERACDEDVMRLGGSPKVYAESILKTCEFCLESPLACVPGITGADLKRRIAQIMSKREMLKLDFGRKILLGAAGLTAVIVPFVFGQVNAAVSSSQVADGDVSFEVATIKPSPPTDNADGMSSNGRRFEIRKGRVSYLMSFAYDIQPRQIANAPAWLMTDKYDIEALMPEGSDSKQAKGMVRRLLAERFGLAFHREKKELPAYLMTVSKGGAKMEVSQPREGSSFHGAGMGHLTVLHGSMPDFARWLNSGILDRPVIDETGLQGKYDFALNWMPDDSQYGGMGGKVPPTTDSANALPGIFTAMQEQIGLKLDATKANVDVLVIDHVGRPTEN